MMYTSIVPNSNWFVKDPSILNSDYYKSIIKCFNKLWTLGILHRSVGQCLALSDLMCKLLKGEGIESELFECSLLVENKITGNYTFIGYEFDSQVDRYGKQTNDIVDTILKDHVVVVTKTEIPIIIDLTCSFLDERYPFILQPLLENEDGCYEIDFETSKWIYTKKQHSHVPIIYQENILNRIKRDTKIDNELKEVCKKLNKINYIILMLCAIAITNFIRGGIDFYAKYINKTNGWGPDPNYIHQSIKP